MGKGRRKEKAESGKEEEASQEREKRKIERGEALRTDARRRGKTQGKIGMQGTSISDTGGTPMEGEVEGRQNKKKKEEEEGQKERTGCRSPDGYQARPDDSSWRVR